MQTNRHVAGTPIGGRFAETTRPVPAGVSLVPEKTTDDEARQTRSVVVESAAWVTGRGTVAAQEKLGGMTDTEVAGVHESLRRTFLSELQSSVDTASEARTNRSLLASAMGPVLGTGTTGVNQLIGSLTDADVDRALTKLNGVWSQATAPAETDSSDPWGAVPELQASASTPPADQQAPEQPYSELLAEDIERR